MKLMKSVNDLAGPPTGLLIPELAEVKINKSLLLINLFPKAPPGLSM